ncbi:MAG: diacylglycerol kinase family lipid kinase [Lachnospiraceae bacterium]|nr:diacylglycerol kinase family lipid kinase [Lachnospiraceae bacterium]
MNLLFIFNPKAGKERIKNRLGDIIELFCLAGHEVHVKETFGSGDATRYVLEAGDCVDRIICAGGDGTLDEVVKGMYLRERKIPIGYIPAGSTNDFASSLGIPTKVTDAAKIAVSDNLFDCDLGGFNEKTFVYVAAFGAFTEVSYATPQDVKNALGYAAYVLEALKRLGDIKSYHMKVTAGETFIEDDFIFGMITNSSSVGGIKNITGPSVDLGDGLFEVTLIKEPKTPADMSAIIAGLSNREYSHDSIYSIKADRITFESRHSVPWTLDGEFGGNEKHVTVINHKREFKIAVKADKK